jgi:hypothetical protein
MAGGRLSPERKQSLLALQQRLQLGRIATTERLERFWFRGPWHGLGWLINRASEPGAERGVDWQLADQKDGGDGG